MAEYLYPVCAVVAWATVGYRVNDLRKDRDNPALRALCGALACVALTVTFAAPPVAALVDRLTGVPCLAVLVAHLSIVGVTATLLRLLLFWTHPADVARVRARRLVPIFAGTLASLVVLFVLAPLDESVSSLASRYARYPYVTEYLLVYLATMAFGMAAIARLSWRYARLARRPWLRRGLRTTVAGALAGISFTACKGAYVCGLRAGVDLAALEAVTPLFASAAVLLLVAGLTLPAWGPRAAGVAGARQRRRAYRQLGPLWRALYQAMPEIALVPPSRSDWLSGDMGFRLYRRVIEIRDGRLALRPYFDDHVADRALRLGRAVGLSGRNLEAAIEAAVLAAALRTRPGGAVAGTSRLDAAGSADLSDEVAWLVCVANAFAGSPVVEAALSGVETSHRPPAGRIPGTVTVP